jgi:hypothetical protein
MDMPYAGGATSDGGIVQYTSAWEVMTYFAATTGRKMTYGTTDGVPTWRTFSFRRKTKR